MPAKINLRISIDQQRIYQPDIIPLRMEISSNHDVWLSEPAIMQYKNYAENWCRNRFKPRSFPMKGKTPEELTETLLHDKLIVEKNPEESEDSRQKWRHLQEDFYICEVWDKDSGSFFQTDETPPTLH